MKTAALLKNDPSLIVDLASFTLTTPQSGASLTESVDTTGAHNGIYLTTLEPTREREINSIPQVGGTSSNGAFKQNTEAILLYADVIVFLCPQRPPTQITHVGVACVRNRFVLRQWPSRYPAINRAETHHVAACLRDCLTSADCNFVTAAMRHHCISHTLPPL